MAALLGPLLGELGSLIGGSGLGPTLARGAVAGIGAVAASDLIKAVQSDISHPDPMVRSAARRVPQYAIVDLHTNKTVRFLSARKVYLILTHPNRGKGRRGSAKVTILREGERMVTVK